MTAQVCPNGAQRTKHHKQRPMQRTNSIQLLDTINATAFSTMLQPQNQAIFSAIFNSLLEEVMPDGGAQPDPELRRAAQ